MAEAGFGKSTAVAVFAAGLERVVWINLDPQDGDLAALPTFVEAALADHGAPRRGGRATRFADPAEAAAALAAAFPRPFTLVLDDFHALPAGAPSVALMQELVQLAPPHLRLIILSRERVPLSLARPRASGDVLEIGAEALRFEPVEVEALLGPAAARLRLWLERIDGWPAALRLLKGLVAAGALPDPDDPAALPDLRRLLHDYLTVEVLARHTDADARLLEKIAVLDEVDEASLAALLSVPAASAGSPSAPHGDHPGPSPVDTDVVARARCLLDAHPGLIRAVDDAVGCWRWHPLFRDCLVARLARRDPVRLRDLRERAAALAEAGGRLAVAFAHRRANADAAALKRLLLAHGEALHARGDDALVLEWLAAVPDADTEPALLCLAGSVRAGRGEFDLAGRLYARAARRSAAAGDRASWARAVGAQARLAELRGSFGEARALWDAGLAEADITGADTATRAGLLLGAANLRLSEGRWREAIGINEEVLRLSEDAGDAARAAMAAHNLGFCYLWLGELAAAAAWCDMSLATKRRLALRPGIAFTLNNLALVHHARGAEAEARRAVEEELALADELGLAALRTYGLCNLAELERDAGRFEAARTLYERAAEGKTALGDAFGLAHALAGRADLERLAGRLDIALVYSETALANRQAVAAEPERLKLRGAWARALLARGESRSAERELREIVAGWRRLDAKVALVQALVDLAAARAALGRPAAPHLREARALALTWGLEAPRQRALRAYPGLGTAEGSAAPGAVAVPAALPADPVHHVVTVAVDHRLRVQSLGPFRVEVDGAVIEEGAWRRRRAKVLLVALLMAGPAGAHRERLIADVWPEAAGEKADYLFYSHLRALRAALEPGLRAGSQTQLVRLVDGRYRLPANVDWDLARFRALVAEADRPDASPGDLEAALALYTGDLLAEPLFAEYDWLFVPREQARADALRLLDRLAEQQLAAGNHEAALSTWQRGVALDPVDERGHRGVIRVHLALGRRADAEAQYRLYRELLRHEVGVAPSPRLRALLQPDAAPTVAPLRPPPGRRAPP